MIVANAPAWPAWTRVTPVLRARIAHGTALVRVRLPPLQIAPDAAGGYPDLRVIDDGGHETPYAIDPAAVSPGDARDLPAIDTGFVPGRGSQAVFDLGERAPLTDTVTLAVDTERTPTYFERVAIDASDDRTTWRDVRADAIVYRVAQDGGRGNDTIVFPPTRSRWLRVRALDARTPFPMTGARVSRSRVAREPSLDALAVQPVEAADAAAHERTWTFVRPRPFRATAVSFDGARGTFARAVRVAVSDDGTTWSDAGDATVSRFADGSGRTAFAFEERTARMVRVTMEDGDDAPLAGVRPVLLARPHAIVFAARPGRAYALLSGADAPAPAYDLPARLAHASWRAEPAYASATVPNPSYVAPAVAAGPPPWLPTAAWSAAAAVLGAAALWTVLRTGPGDGT